MHEGNLGKWISFVVVVVVVLWMQSVGIPPKNGEQTIGFIHHENAPAHRSVLVKHFLAKNNVTTL
jgi:hypothetical protein